MAEKKPNSSIATLDDDLAEQAVEQVSQAKALSGNNFDASLSGNRVRVTFFEQEGDLGKDAIFASLNGVAYNIPRNMPVEIPVEVLEIFSNAVMNAIETTQDGGQRDRQVMRFAYQVHGLVPAAK